MTDTKFICYGGNGGSVTVDLDFVLGVSSGWGITPPTDTYRKWTWHTWVWKTVDGVAEKREKHGHSTTQEYAVRDAQVGLFHLRQHPSAGKQPKE